MAGTDRGVARGWFGSLAGLTAAVVGMLTAPAAAEQHRDANAHQWWTLPAPAYNIDQRLTVRAISDATYFALVVWFAHGSDDDGAYMGIQQLAGGARIARFSIWNSTSATPAKGGTCRDFDGEGIGKTCEIPFRFELDHPYRLRMWRVTGPDNVWGAWIIDEVSHVETAIGQIRAPKADGDVTSADTFDEYFGAARPCDQVPASAADIFAPTLNNSSTATTKVTATPGTPTYGACSGGRVSPAEGGALRIALGADHAAPPPSVPSAPGHGAPTPAGCAATRQLGTGWLAWVVAMALCAANPSPRG
jgi:hypothetical protein